MSYTDTGLYRIGQLIQGKSSLYPSHAGFASGSAAVTGSETSLGSEFLRKSVTWTDSGNTSSIYTVEISNLEANGSNINSTGLFDNASIGSGNMHTYDLSFIGAKNNSFNVQVQGEVIISRPET